MGSMTIIKRSECADIENEAGAALSAKTKADGIRQYELNGSIDERAHRKQKAAARRKNEAARLAGVLNAWSDEDES